VGLCLSLTPMNAKLRKRRLKILRGLMFLAVVTMCYLFLYEPSYSGAVQVADRPLIIAHRGFGNHGPDNGISAVRLAIDHRLDGVDLDAQLTADGELVIFHDATVDRLTDGSGAIEDLTLEELKRFDMGSTFDPKYAGEQIVTFGELLDEVDGKIRVIVEIKSGGVADEGLERIAVDEIRKRDAYDYVILSSFNPFVLYRIKKLDPDVMTMFIFRDIEPYDPTQYRNIPFFLKNETWRRAIRKLVAPDLLSIETTVAPKTFERLHARGYPIFLWVPNDGRSLKDSLAREPYGVITDEPLLALEVTRN